MADIFISYQRQERDAVAIVAEKLRALKFDVWFDEALRAGGSYDEEIASNLKAAKAVLVCWTPAAIASEWVRAEAAMAHNDGRLLAAFLEPTELIPPFNLVHAENLMTWAGQEDDEAWLGLLARFGEMTGRPGVTTYYRAMRPEATVAELRAWAQANGADPLAEHVWERIALIEGESGAARIAREKAEARTRDLKRAENAARSKALAKARGLRDPKEQARRLLRVTVALIVVGLLASAGVGYSFYSTTRLRELDRANTVEQVRGFLKRSTWGPIHEEGLKKFYQIDAVDWATAQAKGTMADYDAYIANYSKAPQGKFLNDAKKAKGNADLVAQAQQLLARLRAYDGEANGNIDAKTYDAITLVQYRRGLIVTGSVDAHLIAKLKQAVADRISTPPDRIPRGRMGVPTEDDYRKLAARLKLDGPTLKAIQKVETAGKGFNADGRMLILFEPHIFSRLTDHKFDTTNPDVSYPKWRDRPYPKTQEGSWAQLVAAAKLDQEAAYQSASYGMFQILGLNYNKVGFESASELVQYMAESEVNQLDIGVRAMAAFNVLDELSNHDWVGFARGYNGPGQVEKYSRLLRDAYEAAQRGLDNAPPEEVQAGSLAPSPVPATPAPTP